MLTFEDFPPGHFGTFGPRRVTREEMLAFAAEYDPQPMHLDEEAASRSLLKGEFPPGTTIVVDVADSKLTFGKREMLELGEKKPAEPMGA